VKHALRLRAREVWTRLRGGELTPLRAALSVAVGLAIGVTPLWGLHFILVLAVCVPLRLDAPVAYLAANISIPLIAPFLTMAELEIGSFLMTGAALPASLASVQARGGALFVREVVAGTAVFAPLMALAGGGVTYAVARAAKRTNIEEDVFARVARRYAGAAGRPAFYYVQSKLRSDPVAARLLALGRAEPLGEVLDAGCGRGQLALMMLDEGVATRVVGFDWDAKKVSAATVAATDPPVPATFSVRDLREPLPSEADTVLLVDVLHYLLPEEQDRVLDEAARCARRRVVIRELDPDRGWRSRVTRLEERMMTGLGYNRGARVAVRPVDAMTSRLERAGFRVNVEPCWGGTPFSNVLVVGVRGASEPSCAVLPRLPTTSGRAVERRQQP
jgi:uncharacterized protein (DUF2062 family)/SAM-dependent methyltransferase